jgi:methionyl-tRNA formyltransferase
MIVEALASLLCGTIVPVPQPETGVSYAAKITSQDLRVDWSQPAQSVAQMIRALNPTPGARTNLGAQMLKLWSAKAHDTKTDRAPGTVLGVAADGIHIACGNGVLSVTELQRAGARRLSAREFVLGCEVRTGERFSS